MKRCRSVSPPPRKKCMIEKSSQNYDSDDLDDIIYDDEFNENYNDYNNDYNNDYKNNKPQQNNKLLLPAICFNLTYLNLYFKYLFL